MPKKAEPMLWDLYALVYDQVMRRSAPYRQLVQEVCRLMELPAGGRLLDAGCGTGNCLEQAARWPEVQAVGMDSSQAMLKRAVNKLKESDNTVLQAGDLDQPLPFEEGVFDVVVCVNALYSTKNPFFTLLQLNRVLTEGGRLVLVTPPEKLRMLPLFREQVRKFQQKYPRWWPLFFGGDLFCLLPYMPLFLGINHLIKGSKDFHFFSREGLGAIARRAGFEVEQLKETYAGQGWLLVGKAIKGRSAGSEAEKRLNLQS